MPLEPRVINELLGKFRPYIFLDYDGTLTPIVPVPAEAILSTAMKNTLAILTEVFSVGIVTGRGRAAITAFVSDEIIQKVSLAASHGFDIHMRHGKMLHVGDNHQLTNFRHFKETLRDYLPEFPDGCCIEETGYSISLHYRHVKREEWALVESMLDSLISRYTGLIRKDGKMVFETRLDVDWDKGKAIEYILSNIIHPNDTLNDIFVIYIGDDITDEDGFQSVNKYPNHLSIIVSPDEEIGRPTHAEYRLCDPTEVHDFLNIMIRSRSC
jgi:trehalose 6-phosphate phosphatase